MESTLKHSSETHQAQFAQWQGHTDSIVKSLQARFQGVVTQQNILNTEFADQLTVLNRAVDGMAQKLRELRKELAEVRKAGPQAGKPALPPRPPAKRDAAVGTPTPPASATHIAIEGQFAKECLVPAVRGMLMPVLPDVELPTWGREFERESRRLEARDEQRYQQVGGTKPEPYSTHEGDFQQEVAEAVVGIKPWLRLAPSLKDVPEGWEVINAALLWKDKPAHFFHQRENPRGQYEEVDSLGSTSKTITLDELQQPKTHKWRLLRLKLDSIRHMPEQSIRQLANTLDMDAAEVFGMPTPAVEEWILQRLLPHYQFSRWPAAQPPPQADKVEFKGGGAPSAGAAIWDKINQSHAAPVVKGTNTEQQREKRKEAAATERKNKQEEQLKLRRAESAATAAPAPSKPAQWKPNGAHSANPYGAAYSYG
eukprot:gene7854-5816_t